MKRHFLSTLACLWLTGAGAFANSFSVAAAAALQSTERAAAAAAKAEASSAKQEDAGGKDSDSPDTHADSGADASAGHGDDGPDYVRMAADTDSTRMETGLASFCLPDGRIVDLVGVVHLGDKAYYQDLNKRLAGYDAVLFELVGDPSALQGKVDSSEADDEPAPPHPLRMLQQTMGRLLRLEFQLQNIDYTRPNFIHADATGEEFEKMQKERGESMMQLMLKSMELSSDPAVSEKFRAAQQIGLGDLILMFYSDKAAARFKIVFGQLLAESEQILEKKILGQNSALIAGRNDVALKKLDEVLADPSKKRVCLFYGAGHMPSMEAVLRTRLKAEPKSFTWLTAWKMPPADPAPAGKEKESAPDGKAEREPDSSK
ncbi:MAG: hypothetical protein JWM59_3416 [Verrucomicrobiales bacterium]|nr:hypothetical protein [Verrucomicrobiales bacterium]